MDRIKAFFAKSVVVGWLWRRVQELAAWAVGLAPLYLTLPPAYQELVIEILQGRGGALSVQTYIGFGYYLFTQWQSYRATVKEQAVVAGKKVALPELAPSTQVTVRTSVENAVARSKAKPGILERIFGKRA